MNKKIIVICEKCKAINYFNRFIWTCPNCGLHFRAKKEEIEEKIKKNLINILKGKFNIHIILGDEFLLDNYDNNINNNNNYQTVNNDGHKLVRKRSFREILEKKKSQFSNEKTIVSKKEKRKFIPRNCNDNLIYSMSSKNKVTIEEATKPILKKRKNYLFDKLLRNQFITQKNISDSKNKNPFKRNNSGTNLTEDKNTLEEPNENKNYNNINNFSGNKFRFRAKSGYLKNDLDEFLKRNKPESENKNEIENDINSICVDDKLDKKKEKFKKNMPPLPFRIKHKLNNINENQDRDNNKLYLQFKYEKQDNYKTPRILLINNSFNLNNIKNEKPNTNIKRN